MLVGIAFIVVVVVVVLVGGGGDDIFGIGESLRVKTLKFIIC